MFSRKSDTLEKIETFRSRRLAVIRDDASSEGRAIILAPAQEISAALVNCIIGKSGGLNFVALSPARVSAFGLDSMASRMTNQVQASSADSLSMCVSVEARENVTTGISAADRAVTISVLGEETPLSRKIVKPGHIFPIQTREGGILVRHGLAEAALDICTIAGFSDAAFFVDLLNQTGSFYSLLEQESLAQELQIPLLNLSSLVRYRLENETLVQKVAEAKLPTRLAGEMKSVVYTSKIDGSEHIALVKGEIHPDVAVLTRVQPEFTFSDVFGGKNPPSRDMLLRSLEAIGKNQSGILLYLRRPENHALKEQITNWNREFRQKPASMMREYGLGAQILRDLGVRKIELLTSSRKELQGLDSFGIEITGQRELGI